MKVNTILIEFFKGIGFHPTDLNYVSNWGFFTFWGMLAGIALNDIWRIFSLPGENLPIVVGNEAQPLHIDYVYQLLIGGLVILSQAFGVKFASGFGTGMLLGSTIANQTEHGQALTLLPFNLPPRT